MREFQGKTAVVTGGASGIGLCLCQVFLNKGMNVVVADIEAPALDQAIDDLSDIGPEVVGVQTDVTSSASVGTLADRAFEAFGAVHVLCNNAGVGIKEAQRRVWTLTERDWAWGYGVNVMGVVNGIRAFVPRMLEGGEEGHVVNTSSSNGGLTSLPTTPIYASTKAAVTSLTEVLHAQFLMDEAALKAHLLFPGPHLVNTNILASERNRPAGLRDGDAPEAYLSMEQLAKSAGVDFQLTEPIEVARTCLAGIENDQFWILPASDKQDARIRERTESILARANPELASA
ncbi:MAG: SDR family NAD(P)-dependent oxidoreductase [Pseudomonadota bacterium]